MTETNKITNQIVDYLLRLPGCFAYRSNTIGIPTSNGSFRPTPKRGVPDITGIYKSKAFYIEVKTGKDRLSEVQKSFISSVEASGGIIMVVSDYDGFIGAFWGKIGQQTDSYPL